MGRKNSYRLLLSTLILPLFMGCSGAQTYEWSKYQFTAPLDVIPNQEGWIPPQRLEIHEVPTTAEICKICNNTEDGGKGSHFKIFGLHKAAIQDRGCYIHSADKSVGRVYYLAGDREAREHEVAHHFHGPAHGAPRPWTRWRHFNSVGGRHVAATGSRIN